MADRLGPPHAMSASNQTAPRCTTVARNVDGVAGAAHVPAGRFSTRYAWLSSSWGSLGGRVEPAYRTEIDPAEDGSPRGRRTRPLSPFPALERGEG